MRTPNVMLVNSSVQAKSVPEFIAYAKAHPGQLSMASGATARRPIWLANYSR